MYPYTEENTVQKQFQPKPIDPQNPFDNPMENRKYHTGYQRILPQVLLPGYEIPLYPEQGERRGIRKCMNAAGLGALCFSVISQLLVSILLSLVVVGLGGNRSEGMAYLESSSIQYALMLLVFSTLNITIAIVGCRLMRTPVRDLFQTEGLSLPLTLRYAVIGIGLQFLAGTLWQLLQQLFSIDQVNVSVDMITSAIGAKSIVAMILYACIIGPIGEEMLFRGFIMKTLSRVSTRFAIIVSALLFGFMHGNFQQAILAFLLGLFLGKIDQRHNSLVPSIIVHIVINTNATLLTLPEMVLPENIATVISSILSLGYIILAIVGIVFWFWKERKQPLPYPTQKQAIRSRLIWTSPLLLAAFAVMILLTIVNEVSLRA